MKAASFEASARHAHPTRAGARPHCALAVLAIVAAVATVGAGCDNGNAQVTPPVVLGMTDQIAPSYQDQEITIYTVQMPVPFPIRKPTDVERKPLENALPPYPRTPFLLNDDERVEVRFTLTNLDDQQHSLELLLDPWNEFARYKGGVTVVNDETTIPNFSGYDKFFVIEGKARIVGTITTDDMHDLAIKLATVENILAQTPAMPNPMDPNSNPTALINRVFNIQNRTNTGDPLFTKYIPGVIAGLTGFDLGLRTYGPANLAVEITIDVTDTSKDGNRVEQPGATDPLMPEPTTILTPPGAR
jgi:hypothetical protein